MNTTALTLLGLYFFVGFGAGLRNYLSCGFNFLGDKIKRDVDDVKISIFIFFFWPVIFMG